MVGVVQLVKKRKAEPNCRVLKDYLRMEGFLPVINFLLTPQAILIVSSRRHLSFYLRIWATVRDEDGRLSLNYVGIGKQWSDDHTSTDSEI